MKRTPIKRKTPLARKTRLRARRARTRASSRDFAYMKWIKRQPCCARPWATTPCYGPVEADHAGRRGYGQKADDRTCIPLCRRHHQERTDFQGAFRLWSQSEMRIWLAGMVERYQNLRVEIPHGPD